MDVVRERFGDQAIVGAEVGVSTGIHALDILQKMPNVKLLYLIDPYHQDSEWNADNKEANPKFLAHKQAAAKKKLSLFNDRLCWVYKKFEECTIKDIPEPLDFIYIDGNHAYEHVIKDITLAGKLVKKGGIIGGHDVGSEGIDRALKEFCKKNQVKFIVEQNESFRVKGTLKQQGWDWWLCFQSPQHRILANQ